MFSNREEKIEHDESDNNVVSKVKYEYPKILLVDIDNDTEFRLRNDGFDIEVGTFGSPYVSTVNEVCELNGKLPLLREKNVVIVRINRDIDLTGYNPRNENILEYANEVCLYTPSGQNYFDGRNLFSSVYKEDFQQVLKNGGIIIVFADFPVTETYYSQQTTGYRNVNKTSDVIDNYKWMPIKTYPVGCDLGKTVIPNENIKELALGIINGCDDQISFTCEFNEDDDDETLILFRNLSDNVVSYMKKVFNGIIIVLPRFDDLYKPIKNLITEILPEINPDFFPDFVKNNWLDKGEYILPEVKATLERKERIIEEYETQLNELDAEISKIKEDNKFITNIITTQGQGDFLVSNVKKVLEYIGYNSVIDVDQIIEGNKQEDLRITDNGIFTVVEVKGLASVPSEDDCQALLKYINRNMKQENRTDIHGLLIINHQRHLEPLKRNYPAFTNEQILDATRDGYTLVSAWELYKITRLLQESLVTFEDIHELLHTKGLFQAIPKSWSYLGDIEHMYDRNQEGNIACFNLEADSIEKGDLLVINYGNEYFVQLVKEMKANDEYVNKAKLGDRLSVKIDRIIDSKSKVYVNLK